MVEKAISPVKGVIIMVVITVFLYILFGVLPLGLHSSL